MSPERELLLLTSDRSLEDAVSRVTEGLVVSCVRSMADFGDRLTAGGAPLALVDVEPRPLENLAHLEPLVRRFPDTRFVVLCKEPDSALLLEAMQVGARHCMARGRISAELPGVLERLLPTGSQTTRAQGQAVTILSASGGCGATALAINLAEELRDASGKQVLLVDLDTHFGTMAGYLGMTGSFSVADVLSHQGSIDGALVTTTAREHSPGLHLLLSPASVDPLHPQPLNHERLAPALWASRGAYAYTVVEAPRLPIDSALALARASTLTLVVFELAVIDLRFARTLLQGLALELPRAALLGVCNRYYKRSPMIGLDDAREVLEGFAMHTVSNDFSGMLKSLNLGQPLSRVSPRSAARKDLRELAHLVIERGRAAAREEVL